MKSAARSLGALALGEVLAALEVACHEETSKVAGKAVPSLAAQACDEIRAALRALSQLGNQPLELAADATINAPAPSAPMALHEEAARAAMASSSARAITTKSNAADEHTLGASAIANTGSDESTRGHRALIADDDEVSRSIVASWLRSDGYFVVEAADGQIALDHFARDEFDLILLDVLMPVRNGYETCKSIRELPHGRHIPIVMLTGLDDDEAVHFAYECGATDFIIKPIVEEILRNRLRYIQRAGRLSDELRRSEARLRRAQLAARVSYWEWDPQTRQMHVGEGVAHLLNDAIADDTTAIDTVRALFGAEDQHVIERILAGETIDAGTLENQRVDAGGTLTYIAQRVECIVDTVTGKTRWLGTVQDITEQRRNEQRIYRISHFDSLTGMPNQLFLSKSLGMFLKLAHRQQKRVAYLVIDSGEQQQIASALGHDYHDQYVLEIANRLRTQLRGSDLFVRLPDPDGLTNAEDARAALVHGDRFSAALNSIGGHEDVARISERLIEALAIPIELGSEALFPRINIGIAMFPEDGEDFETLHQHALTALNQIGDNQQTGYHWYQQERDAAARERIALERDLRYAVERGELRVFYQPRLDAHTGAVLGMEALVRWQRDGQMISPARFIPIAEQTGVINQLGEYVLERSVAMLAAWLKRGLPPLRVSVNVSGRQFRESNLPALCSAALTRHKLPPEYLELELTEGILIDASDNVLQQLHVLNDMGINLALDDFGTGFSSLGYLSRFPLHVLKIDKSFVDKLNDNEHNRVIVRSTLTLAHDLGLRVVAEGVETEAQRQWLVDHACDELQGYLFAKPLPPDEFEHWVLQHASAPPMSPTTIVRSNVQ